MGNGLASEIIFNGSSPQLLIDAVQGVCVMVKDLRGLLMHSRQTDI